MIDVQPNSPPLGLEYTIPLPPSPEPSPTRCDRSSDSSDATCFYEPLQPAHTTTPSHHPERENCTNLEESRSVSESGPSGPQDVPDSRPNPPAEPVQLPLRPSKVSPSGTCGHVTFDELVIRSRQRQHAEKQRRSLERRLLSAKISISLLSRLRRVTATVQRGLVETFKHGDKSGFVAIYNTLFDLQEACDSSLHQNASRHFLRDDLPLSSHPSRSPSAGFMHQLTSKARSDLLEILNLVRTDAQFLFDRITSLMPSQLAALTSSPTSTETGDSVLSFASRIRNPPLFAKRPLTQSIPFKEHALAFERTDPLSILLFNVFAVPLDWDPLESRLRLDVWSSTCAKLISAGDSRYYAFTGHVVSYWCQCSDWKARAKLELYLMDVLQKGAFLLESIESPNANTMTAELPDPLRTDAAEEFFETAVHSLFEVLDDSDAGLPTAALELTNAILSRIPNKDTGNRFLEYIFVQWFFSRFLYNALSFPETQGLLLDFHISKDARERLLGQIALRAQSQIFRVLHSVPQFSTAHPEVRQHVDNMFSKFTCSSMAESIPLPPESPRGSATPPIGSSSSSFVTLSSADVQTLLNALFPKPAFGTYDSSSPSGHQNMQLHSQYPLAPRIGRVPETVHSFGRIEAVPEHSSHGDRHSEAYPRNTIFTRNAEYIRALLSDGADPEDRPHLENPSVEDWTVFGLSQDVKSLIWPVPSPRSRDVSGCFADESLRSGNLPLEEDHEALQTAIVKLIDESDSLIPSVPRPGSPLFDPSRSSLFQRFARARSLCEDRSDFIGAHYWWAASEQLKQSLVKTNNLATDDTWILGSMLGSCNRALAKCEDVIRHCESKFMALSPVLERLQAISRDTVALSTRLRNKMWYMTDVKNSMRYEDAKHVALALKTMVYPPSLFPPPNEYRFRHGTRYLAGSFLQKPEIQVMNLMKAPTSQGGPNKLSDEQVELTRKWITHHGIENFCRGEERIHRFCYEVKTSVTKLVGDSMAETPVLWASELFQKERAKFEASSNRGFSGVSLTPGMRPLSVGSEDVFYSSQPGSLNFRQSEGSRPSAEMPPLLRQSSFQSLPLEKWKIPRNYEPGDTSSMGDSPGKTPTSSTVDSYSTFWSPAQTQAQSAASASSIPSRPPSMFSDGPILRRAEREIHGKAAFLDDLRQTLTSLLLSDLGSPVWSCGSETDAWFTDFLNQARIQVQMDKRARIQKFMAESDAILQQASQPTRGRGQFTHRRSQSAEAILFHSQTREAALPPDEELESSHHAESGFGYEVAFRQLINVFSRSANPFVKLKALRDVRALVAASLHPPYDSSSLSSGKSSSETITAARLAENKNQRHSCVEPWTQRTEDDYSHNAPSSPPVESVDYGSHQSFNLGSTEVQIVTVIKDLLRRFQPRTLFRDLQFISAFVSSETLNKSDSGTAFLHFGLAALALKEEVCSSMVDIADRIVSQELNRRHFPPSYESESRPGFAIEDAARMWIITAKEGNPVAQRELAILYLTHPELLPRVTLPLTLPRDTFKAEMMYRRDKDSKSDPQSMCLALHWMQLSANGGDELARNRLREREEFESII